MTWSARDKAGALGLAALAAATAATALLAGWPAMRDRNAVDRRNAAYAATHPRRVGLGPDPQVDLDAEDLAFACASVHGVVDKQACAEVQAAQAAYRRAAPGP